MVEPRGQSSSSNSVELQVSGKNLYFHNKSIPGNVWQKDFSSPLRAIATKLYKFLLCLVRLIGISRRKKFKLHKHFQTKNDEIIFSPSQGKKRYTYVMGTFNFWGYKPYTLNILIDTGATICTCKWNAIPKEKWVLMKHPILVTGIDGGNTEIQFKAKNISIWMGNTKFVIPKIICFPYMHGDILLGNNFIYQYLPMHIYEKELALTVKSTLVHIPLLEQHKYVCNRDFAPVPRGEMTPIIKAIDESHWIYKVLEENFSEDPLKL